MIADAPEGLDVVGVTPESVRKFSLIRKTQRNNFFFMCQVILMI